MRSICIGIVCSTYDIATSLLFCYKLIIYEISSFCGVYTYTDCGIKPEDQAEQSGSDRIVGGNETEPNEFPWQVLLEVIIVAKKC